MKRFTLLALYIVMCLTANATTDYSAYKGVWANDSAEAVITDSVCIYYTKADTTMQATLAIPSRGVLHHTVFTPCGKVNFPKAEPLKITKDGKTLNINGQVLSRIENIKTVTPHEMPRCESKYDVGKCLQQWRLGAGFGLSDDMIYCEINTNRHMFVYMVSPAMEYIRAAATRNNDQGTLFFQNIRMMRNRNTGEYTMDIMPGNLNFARNDLEIDNSKFQPDRCTFSRDGGIYWSLISFEPDIITLNGCGETYQVKRPSIADDMEYFEYVPYAPDSSFSTLR